MTRLAALMLALCVICAGAGCGACDDAYLAELAKFQGDVQRDEARTVGSWGAVKAGDRFHVGDGLRTGARGSAELSLASDGVALVEANTLLRFLDRDPRAGDRRLALEQGVVRIESGRVELDVHTPRALARVAENTTVRIVALDRDLHFDVLVGRVAIEDDTGSSEIKAGEQRTIAARPSVPDGGPPRGAVDAGAANAPEPVRDASLERSADIALPALESMTLHAPTLPLTARVGAPACDDRITVEIDGRPVDAQPEAGTLLLELRPGQHSFRVRCGRKIAQQGSVRALRDQATLELPKSAQRLDVEADGRRYTVRYQNLLPIVTARWKTAREAAGYTLHLRRAKRERKFAAAEPEHTLPAGELSEGDHEFWFTSAGGQRSEVTRLRIEFDNTARSLSLSEPTESSEAEDGRVWVSGVALLRSQVSANGVPLPLDAKGRFRARVPLTAERTVVVRAIHPAAGVHYYVRQLR